MSELLFLPLAEEPNCEVISLRCRAISLLDGNCWFVVHSSYCTLYSILLQRCSLKQKTNNEKASLKLVNAKVFLCSLLLLVLYRLQELMFWSLCISLRGCLFTLFSCMFLKAASFLSYSIALDHKEKNSMLNVSWYSCYTRIEAELLILGNFKCQCMK